MSKNNYSKEYDKDDRTKKSPNGGNSNGKKRRNRKGNKGKNGSRPDNRRSSSNYPTSGRGTDLGSGLYADNTSPGRNDIDWYTRNPELVAVASRLATPYRPGSVLDIGPYSMVNSTDQPTHPKLTIPGVMSLEFVPTVGYSLDTNSPASICAARMWAQIRSHFSSDLTVDPPDMFMYIYAVGQIQAYIEHMKRLYRAVNTYSADNYDYPKNVVMALMPSMTAAMQETLFNDLKRNRVFLYTQINEMVNAINVFRVPDQYPILHRMRWLNTHVYMDEDRPNAQTYVFRQVAYYTIDENGVGATKLTPVVLNATYNSVDAIVNVGWNMIKALQEWEDAYTINGYIARAWEGSNALIESYLAEYEILIPTYNAEVLHQIENANLCPIDYYGNNIADIDQIPDTGAIYHTPEAPITFSIGAYILNCHDRNSDADNIIGTRLMSYYDDAGSNMGRLSIVGTEVLTGIRVVYGSARFGANDYTFLNTTHFNLRSGTITQTNAISDLETLRMFFTMQWWHHHPTIYLSITHSAEFAATSDAYRAFDGYNVIPLCDLDQATRVDFPWLRQLHRITMYSLFNVFNKSDVINRNANYK